MGDVASVNVAAQMTLGDVVCGKATIGRNEWGLLP